ncbi:MULTISPECIES: hypothetical protein [unclassified Streptomyces]|uniref:hypothetical protein n=1 Tax=unclassified Streptomyces TaxID=2593676 RepID=UPI000A955270|nr:MULTISPECIES: hypothetical protein [unclassified Streptomyces]
MIALPVKGGSMMPLHLLPLLLGNPAVQEPRLPNGLLLDDAPGGAQRLQTRLLTGVGPTGRAAC